MNTMDGTLYKVEDGDCLISIASDHGFYWKTLWKHPNNSELKRLRKSPTILLQGDEVFIPDKVPGEVSAATDARYRYKKLGTPAMLRLRIHEQSKPLEGVKYIAEIDGHPTQGKTDANGLIQLRIPPAARDAIVRVYKSDNEVEVHHLNLGALDPITEDSGVQARLHNLGFDCGEHGSRYAHALRSFQVNNKLNPTGAPDSPTKDAIVKAHGS